MSLRIAVIAEAEADRRQACEMIDRKIMEHAPDWWDDAQLEAEREYCGLLPSTLFTRWRELRDLPSPIGALRRGGFIGFQERRPVHFDYPLGRKALISCTLAEPRIDAVVLVRDMDQQPKERAASLEQARDEIPANALVIVLALPTAKREAWVLNGFEPENEQERAALEEARQDLGFDPRLHSERLHAMEHGAKRDAKRVLRCLVGEDREREAMCWRQASWKTLRERGKENRLNQFLAEIKDRLVPLIVGP